MKRELLFQLEPGFLSLRHYIEVGNGNITSAKGKSHFIIWCVSKSPLLLGNDLRTVDTETIAIVTNPGAIAINQVRQVRA